MTTDLRKKLDQLRTLTSAISLRLRAAEDWEEGYRKHDPTFQQLLKMELRLERKLKAYFKDLSTQTNQLINWHNYNLQLMPVKTAFNVKVTVNDDHINDQVNILLNIVYDELLDGMDSGAAAQDALYGLGMTDNIRTLVEKAARQKAGDLAKGLTDTTRQRVKDSIGTSLKLGEDIGAATTRLKDIIDDPGRAQLIARTESVASYSQGTLQYGIGTQAISKTWGTVPDACPECADLEDETVDINDSFSSGDDAPPAHPNCRCRLILNYANGDSEESNS